MQPVMCQLSSFENTLLISIVFYDCHIAAVTIAYNTVAVYIVPLAASLATHGVAQVWIVPTPGTIVPVVDITDGKMYDAKAAPIFYIYIIAFIYY